jgi:hypothetical protein
VLGAACAPDYGEPSKVYRQPPVTGYILAVVDADLFPDRRITGETVETAFTFVCHRKTVHYQRYLTVTFGQFLAITKDMLVPCALAPEVIRRSGLLGRYGRNLDCLPVIFSLTY